MKNQSEDDPSLPRVNLLVIRSKDIDRAARFYERIGIKFEHHRHGQGPMHYSASLNHFVLEIYPDDSGTVSPVRFGFSVDDVDATLDKLVLAGAKVTVAASDSPWGRRAVFQDLDGNTVELLSANLPE